MKNFKAKLSKIGEHLLNIMYPKHIKCIFFGEELTEKAYNDTCVDCWKTLPFVERPCLRCGGSVEEVQGNVCLTCHKLNHNFVSARAVFDYTDMIVGLVHKFKYNNKSFLFEPMSNFMTEKLSTWGIEPDIITFVPLHKNKQKSRSFNQAELLAKSIAEKFDIKCIGLCEKIVDNYSQASLNFKDRQENVKDAYKFINRHKQEVKNKIILLIDDIMTTGATADEISKVLLNAGAKEIYVLNFAHRSLFEETKK
ncbi:MAG: ComF family protein [Clostridia bacterium]|nr:ComF family protein [Clostridia bacterium]